MSYLKTSKTDLGRDGGGIRHQLHRGCQGGAAFDGAAVWKLPELGHYRHVQGGAGALWPVLLQVRTLLLLRQVCTVTSICTCFPDAYLHVECACCALTNQYAPLSFSRHSSSEEVRGLCNFTSTNRPEAPPFSLPMKQISAGRVWVGRV